MEPEKKTIKLSDRAPVTIVVAEWPEISRGAWHSPGEALIQVLRHRDGRTIVHGSRAGYSSCVSRAAGFLLKAGASSDDTVRAIRRVVGALGHDLDGVADEAIGNLPPEAI